MRTEKHKNLYNTDFVAWTFLQSDLLKTHKFNELDIEHIAEEIEDLGAKHKRELYNRLIKLLLHLLKMQFQTSNCCQSWKSTIHEQKKNIRFLLRENPSLKKLVSEYLPECYEMAKEEAILEMGEIDCDLPKECIWSEKEILQMIDGK